MEEVEGGEEVREEVSAGITLGEFIKTLPRGKVYTSVVVNHVLNVILFFTFSSLPRRRSSWMK